MKISFFDDEPEIFPLQYGGKARTITNLATEFAKLPEIEKVTILSRSIFSNKKEFVKNGVNYIVLDDDNTIEKIAYEMDNTDILNIHCCSFTFPFITGRAKKFYFLHDVLIATAEKGSHLDKSLGGQFDSIIAPSEFAKSIYEKNRKIIDGQIECHVIPRHINTEMFYHIKKEEIKKDNQAPQIIKDIIDKYDFILFFPSRPIEEKGGGYLIELSKELSKTVKNFCIIGPFGINSLLPKTCINTGWIKSEDLKYYYSIADVTLNFSLLPESFSQICIESVCCKTPIVSFESGNIPSFNKITDAVVLVDKNIDSIINGVKYAIVMKKDFDKMEKEYELIINNFEVKKIINEYLDLYRKYIGV